MIQAELFWDLLEAKTEAEVEQVISDISLPTAVRWHPLGGNESNFGVIENQQSSPVAAIVEKLTNSIDAILMRRCLEEGIDPRSSDAPRSVEEAIERFFPNHKHWDLSTWRNLQAEDIQIIGNGDSRSAGTSLIIYDNGEGQHPEEFENTFLSLLRGNKNEIHFVQGKYNMGGSGAIVFCGKQRYQLIASKRYDNSGLLGFTLIRKHPLTGQETRTKKNTWYEYLKIDGKIPAFSAGDLDLGLLRRNFSTGTIIKLYSYDVKGNKHVRRDLARSLNEFLYEPALPIYTVETKERYPNDRALDGVIFGLKRQLGEDNEYVDQTFSEEYTDRKMGKVKVTVHVFKTRAKGKTPAETRTTIQNEYFKNRMAVLFSMNGQVHGHYTSEFITRSLQFNLLRDYLLIHVDCTHMHIDFRNELFMASRDRLKQGEESSDLRRFLAANLKKGQLKDIYKQRKDSISVDANADEDVLKAFAKNLPINDEMRKLLSKTFKLEQGEQQKKPQPTPGNNNSHGKPDKPEFHPKRYPSFFSIDASKKGNTHVFSLPVGGEKTVQFSTDVEDQYFDRSEDPGDLQIAVMDYVPNKTTGGTAKGDVNHISDLLNVVKRSPHEGTIRIVFSPTADVEIGDEIELSVDLTCPGKDLNQIFWIKIAEPKQKPSVTEPKSIEEPIGLPKLVRVYREANDDEDVMTWEKLSNDGIDMTFETVLFPFAEGDILDTVYINMDSAVLKDYKSKLKSMEQHQLADRRYQSAIYFHTLFLYAINKRRGYEMYRNGDNEDDQSVDISDYLRDVFSSHYAAFLLNFGTSELVEALG